MMPSFALLSALVTLGALFSFLSYRVLRLPTSIGTMVLSLAAACALIVGGHTVPALQASAHLLVSGIDFNQAVLHGMLAFLLFAGALQLDLKQLGCERVSVLSLAIFATAISTVIVGFLFKTGLHIAGIPISWTQALLFGALISPTDPIAVLDMLQRVGAPPELKIQLAGESLFNDGVGAVIFVALLGASAKGSGHGSLPSPATFGALLLGEAGGGIVLGMTLGYLTYRLIRMVDSYRVEVMLTLALAMGGYVLADKLHLSAPLEAVAAGLMVSGTARRFAMSPNTRDHLEKFWELIDDIMNVVLFLLLGLQLLILPLSFSLLTAGLIAIPIVLIARFASVTAVVRTLAVCRQRVTGNVMILTWGGLRGALAVALALSLPQEPARERNLLLAATYITVVFSILVQGLTISPFLRRMQGRLGNVSC
ncbi:sodium:proton antiporter [Terriglobus sp. TAA 43]|uniref:cation:proton antiporter n=1 Tax=Terriglobus sp. TAA 43 TaxID=278961 RepID=UPI0018DD21C0|nr:sodium:proton antiporter [Terriglobus sp. TAA 43]